MAQQQGQLGQLEHQVQPVQPATLLSGLGEPQRTTFCVQVAAGRAVG